MQGLKVWGRKGDMEEMDDITTKMNGISTKLNDIFPKEDDIFLKTSNIFQKTDNFFIILIQFRKNFSLIVRIT